MRVRKDHSRYLVVARGGDDRWHPVHRGTLTAEQAALLHHETLPRQGTPDRCQIWTTAQSLSDDAAQAVDVWAQGA